MGRHCFLPKLLCLLSGLFTLQAEEPLPVIRNLPVEVIEQLGQELYQRDQLAWKATDAIQAEYPESKSMRLQGWITELGKPTSRVYFIRKSPKDDGALELAYLVEFDEAGETTVIPKLGEPLPEDVALRFRARSTAIDAMPGFYDRPYNIEVLKDPEGDGFLVYVMVATQEAHEIVIGGHVRITVSADGRQAEQVDELSRSLLIIDKRKRESSEAIATVVSHIVSPTPVETHIFNALLHEVPLFVTTGEDEVWMVQGGKMKRHRFDPEEE